MTNEYVDELSVIGYTEVPEVQGLFEQSGQFYVHRNCALWSSGVVKNGKCQMCNYEKRV